MSDTDAINAIGLLNEMLINGQTMEAETLFKSLKPHLAEHIIFECAGNIEFYKRNLQNAVNCYEAAIHLAPHRKIARYQYLVGTREEVGGNLEAAVKRYAAAIDAEPSFVDAYVELGGILAKRGQYEIAAQCFRDVIRLQPNGARHYFNLVAVLSQLVKKNPTLYSHELDTATKMYGELEKSQDITDLKNHAW